MKNLLGVIALVAVGIVKADAAPTEADCISRAQMAYAVAIARDEGRAQHELNRRIDSAERVEQRTTMKRIVFNVYTSSTSKDAAYDSEKHRCQGEIKRNQK